MSAPSEAEFISRGIEYAAATGQQFSISRLRKIFQRNGPELARILQYDDPTGEAVVDGILANRTSLHHLQKKRPETSRQEDPRAA